MTTPQESRGRAEEYATMLDCLDSAIKHLDPDDESDRRALQALLGAKSYALRLNTAEERP